MNNPLDNLTAALRITDPIERAKALTKTLDELPALNSWIRAQRQAAVNEGRALGLSYADIAARLGLHRTRVAQIAKGVSGGSKKKDAPSPTEPEAP